MWCIYKMSIYNNEFDGIDRKIAECIMQDANLTSQQLGEKVGLSASAANERLRHLKQAGAIKRMTALVSADFMDMNLCAFIFVVIDHHSHHKNFLEAIRHHPSILECHHVTGDYSYILKVRLADTKALESLISNFMKAECHVSKTMTQIVLSSHKDECLIVE